jgi:hypothetical protein
MCVCVVGRITDEQRLQFPNERRRKQKKKFFFVCFSRSFFFKNFFGGGLEKMSRMEFDGVEKNNLVDVEIAKKKRKRAAYVLRGGERNKEILAEKSRDVNARVSIEKENN